MSADNDNPDDTELGRQLAEQAHTLAGGDWERAQVLLAEAAVIALLTGCTTFADEPQR